MYADLKKHIIHNEVIEHTVAWYMKMFFEHCKDQVYVSELLQSMNENRNIINIEDVYPFDNLIFDWHMMDILEKENAILNLILKCFTMDYELNNELGYSVIDVFFNYTSRGRKILGNSDQDNLTAYFDEWSDLLNLFKELSDDEIKEHMNDQEELEDLLGITEMAFNGMIINIKYASRIVDELLTDLDFEEIEPGVYVFARYYCYGYEEGYTDISKSLLERLIEALEEKVDDLSEYDELFKLWNYRENTKLVNAIKNLRRYSKKEVIF